MQKSGYRSGACHTQYRYMINLTPQPKAIFGPRVTGPTIPIITGSLAFGWLRRASDSCGLPDTGAITAAITSSTTATGARPSGSTAGSITATATGDRATTADDGSAIRSAITAP